MSDTNNNFEELKRLLKLKRHEVPPPGYFSRFSGDVLSRIEAGEAGGAEGLLGQLQERSSFFKGLLHIFEARPGVIGGFATGLCLLLLVTAVLADRPESASADNDTVASPSEVAPGPALASVMPLTAAGTGGITISTNPLVSLQPSATLFGSQQNPLFQPASFMPASR